MKEDFSKVEGGDFIKSNRTKAILAVNKNILIQNEARKKLGKKLTSNDEEINNLKDKMNQLTEDMDEIKSMLKHLIKNKE
jgi:ACT domain-containing protein